jgi:SM-20-related protein
VLDLVRLGTGTLHQKPFQWACIDELFPTDEALELAESFPVDHYMTIPVNDVDPPYTYEARSFIKLGRDTLSYPERLTTPWHDLAEVLASADYRAAMSRLTGLDLSTAPMEVNLYRYGPEAWLKPHCDIAPKRVTHVQYFNAHWQPSDGGCLRILTAPDLTAQVAEIAPLAGRSTVLVRSTGSWHAISPVSSNCRNSRCSMNVIFYEAGFSDTMWPFDGEAACLHDYASP